MPPRLLNGHDSYENMDPADRKRLLSSFRVFFRHMPVRYTCITLKTKEHGDLDGVTTAMRKRLIDFLFDKLAYFQDFDAVKIYYDDGQKSVAQAIHKAVDYALSKDAVVYRLASSSDYRLSQIADYICTMELTALKYADRGVHSNRREVLRLVVAVQERYPQGSASEENLARRYLTSHRSAVCKPFAAIAQE